MSILFIHEINFKKHYLHKYRTSCGLNNNTACTWEQVFLSTKKRNSHGKTLGVTIVTGRNQTKLCKRHYHA